MKQTTTVDLDDDKQMTQADAVKVEKMFDHFKGQRITITVDKFKKKRSNPQNAYFHGVVIPHVRDGLLDVGTEITTEQTKDMLKSMFASETKQLIGDDYITVTIPTSAMTTTQFMDFIDKIQRWGAEFLGINIPDPTESISHDK